MRGHKKWRIMSVGLVGAVLLVASCGYGEAWTADQVSDVSARLNGLAKSTILGTTTYYFEYGTTDGYGSATATESVEITDTAVGIPVSATIDALDEGTVYHYRLCVDASDGVGSCSDDLTVTTSIGRDSVTGTGFVLVNQAAGLAVGGSVDVNGTADGYFPVGTASVGVLVDGALAGQVTCLRVEGHRASVGFVTNADPQTPWMITIEDNGPSGDRWTATSIGVAATICPLPTEADLTPTNVGFASLGPAVVDGDFIVHDHIDEL